MPIATAISVTQITSRRNSPPTPESFEVRSVCRRKSVAVTGGDFSVMMQPSIAIDGPTPRTNGSDVHALTNGHAVEMGPTTNGVANVSTAKGMSFASEIRSLYLSEAA